MPWYNQIGGSPKYAATKFYTASPCSSQAMSSHVAMHHMGGGSGQRSSRGKSDTSCKTKSSYSYYGPPAQLNVASWSFKFFDTMTRSHTERQADMADMKGAYWDETPKTRTANLAENAESYASAVNVGFYSFEKKWTDAEASLSKYKQALANGQSTFLYTGSAFQLWISASTETKAMLNNVATNVREIAKDTDQVDAGAVVGRLDDMAEKLERVLDDDYLVGLIGLELNRRKVSKWVKDGTRRAGLVEQTTSQLRTRNRLTHSMDDGTEELTKEAAAQKAEALVQRAETLSNDEAFELALAPFATT